MATSRDVNELIDAAVAGLALTDDEIQRIAEYIADAGLTRLLLVVLDDSLQGSNGKARHSRLRAGS